MASLEKAILINTATSAVIAVMFNPAEYSLDKDNNYASMGVPGLSGPLLQFVHGNARTLSMELFFDTYEENRRGSAIVNAAQSDVRIQVRKVTRLMEIEPSLHTPPVVEFHWGSLHFTGVLTKASQKYTMFLPTGIPVRATVQVTFQEYINSDRENDPIGRETRDFTKRHWVQHGETLASIAAKYYGEPAEWRAIAARNDIDHVGRLNPGTLLTIPRLPLAPLDQDALAEGRSLK